ncbi:MAG: glycine--tRNA ligase subunit beta [Thermodesulfobacteriota bacterium]
MSQELFIEIGTEEIPASYIKPALGHLQDTVTARLSELNLEHGPVKTTATPRRLCLVVEDLAGCQPDQRLEVMGPPRTAGFDQDNKPTKAAIGFAASRGATVDDIQIKETAKGEYLMVVQEVVGQPSDKLLPELLTKAILAMPFPKSMRWADHDTLFARPIQWLCALYSGEIVPLEIAGVKSSSSSRGHRFNGASEVAVQDFRHYRQEMARLQVMVDMDERQAQVAREINEAAKSSGGEIVMDQTLLATVTNLVESPHGVCGSFSQKFLELPDEVLTTSMAVNQKYFTLADDKGALLPYFVAVNNTEVKDLAISRQGHERVLRARLEDALFFFNEDRKKTLESRRPSLEGVIFQAGLGTMAEKAERIQGLATHLAASLAPELTEEVARASKLCKADLVTDMVGEFPSLQGIMGKYYAQHDGEQAQVAEAIADHYRPLRAGSPLPESVAGALVSIADRLDTISGCFALGKRPTGATDPYGLRRHALAVIHIINARGWQLPLAATISKALAQYGAKEMESGPETVAAIVDFIKGRYSNDKVAAGASGESVEAATSVLFDDIHDCNQRISALEAIAHDETFTMLAGSFKRVSNIIKEHEASEVDEELLVPGAEKGLWQSFQTVAEKCAPLLGSQDYPGALAAILTLKDPIDTFFDEVMVMDKDEKIKANRLSLLNAIAQLFRQIGDLAKMYTLAR